MKQTLKNIAGTIGGLGLIIGFLLITALLAVVFIEGVASVSAKLYPWLIDISGVTFAITLFVLLPNAVFSATPRFAGSGMIIASYIFGASLWVYSFLMTYALWGGFALIVGLFFFGVGVVPIAILATLFNGMWSAVGELMLLTAL